MAAPTLTKDMYRSERISRNLACLTGSLAFGAYESNGVDSSSITGYFKTCLQMLVEPCSGYLFDWDKTNNKIKVYWSSGTPTLSNENAHTHAVALDSGASAAGTSHNHAFTGTAPVSDLDLATPAFSGTGLTASGQDMTTTDNQTMTLNQCAGMWLIPATGATPVMLILSNTAVTAAPAVLTVQGAAATDAGAYKIVKALAPVGTNAAEATHTHASGTLADAASDAGSSHTHYTTAEVAVEVNNGYNLVALTAVKFIAVGLM